MGCGRGELEGNTGHELDPCVREPGVVLVTVVCHVMQDQTTEALDRTLGAGLDAPRLPDLLPLHDLFVAHNQLICELPQIHHFNYIVNIININDNMQR